MARNRVLAGSLSQALISSSLTTNHGVDVYNVHAANGSPVTVTLDPKPSDGDRVVVFDVGFNATRQPITIEASEEIPIGSGTIAMSLAKSGTGIQFTYSVATGGWSAQPITVDDLSIPVGAVGGATGLLIPYTGAAVALPAPVKYASADAVTAAQANSMANAAFAMGITAPLAQPNGQIYVVPYAWYINFTGRSPTPLTPGDTYYLSPSVAGGITNVRPTTSGQIVQSLGVAIDENILLFSLGTPIQL